jgi:hypothetical protein
MNLRGMMLLVCVLAFAQQANADVVHARRAFVQELCNDVWRSKVQKVYVPDFTDESGKFSSLGRFFADNRYQTTEATALNMTTWVVPQPLSGRVFTGPTYADYRESVAFCGGWLRQIEMHS